MVDYSPSKTIKIICQNPSGNHSMTVHEWGEKDYSDVVLCLHGLTRSALDFVVLASHLKKDIKILAPDLVGRGDSDWLRNNNFYQVSQYISDINTMLIKLNVKKVNIVGTSLGGLIGIVMSSIVNGTDLNEISSVENFFLPSGISSLKFDNKISIESLVINDFGIKISIDSLLELSRQVDFDLSREFENFRSAQDHVEKICKDFGPHSDLQWKLLTNSYFKTGKKLGSYVVHFDPKILSQFKAFQSVFSMQKKVNLFSIPDLDFSNFYDSIECKTLLLRGEKSSLLTKETANDMTLRGPKPLLVEFDGIGHAPTLMQLDQISIIKNFLSL